MKPNVNRLQGPGANPTPRLSGQNNTDPGYKYQEQQPDRATKLLTKVYGEEQNFKINALGLNSKQGRSNWDLSSGRRNPVQRSSGPDSRSGRGRSNRNDSSEYRNLAMSCSRRIHRLIAATSAAISNRNLIRHLISI